MFKILLVIVFIAVLISLGSSFVFLMKDLGKRKRMVYMLFVRVGLSFLLLFLIVYGYYSGELSPHAPF